jgi:hypothetical protein
MVRDALVKNLVTIAETISAADPFLPLLSRTAVAGIAPTIYSPAAVQLASTRAECPVAECGRRRASMAKFGVSTRWARLYEPLYAAVCR